MEATLTKKDVNIWSSHETGLAEEAFKQGFKATIDAEPIVFAAGDKSYAKKDGSQVRFVKPVEGTSGYKTWMKTKYGKSVTLSNIEISR